MCRLRSFIFAIILAFVANLAALADAPHRVLILGDSITEGYGVAKDDSFPSILQQELKTEGHPQTIIINAGIGGSTTASGVSRLKWSLKGKPDILIVALGGNDGLRGLKPEETKKNIKSIVELGKQNGLRVILAGMKAPPNYGAAYTKAFEKLFSDIAHEEKVTLIPFLLEGVAGDPSLNQADGIHPNEKGHTRVANHVKKYLEPFL
jgi:acyl-CoA thioesterase-1